MLLTNQINCYMEKANSVGSVSVRSALGNLNLKLISPTVLKFWGIENSKLMLDTPYANITDKAENISPLRVMWN